MWSSYLIAASFAATFLFLSYVRRRIHSRSIAHLPGPPPGPWLVGNWPELARPKEIGDADFAWTRDHGTAVCVKGMFGTDTLFTSDPKALQYILNTAGYNFPKPPNNRAAVLVSTGPGIIWAEGVQHARHRKAMDAAFSHKAINGFLPLFQRMAKKTMVKLKEQVSRDGGGSSVINISPWLARTTLDVIGSAGFDYQFGAIDEGSDNKLAKAYHSLFAETFLDRPDSWLVMEYIMGILPMWCLTLMLRLPDKKLQRLNDYLRTAREVAQEVMDRQIISFSQGKEGSKDILSTLIKANLSENPKTRLRDDEVISQLTTLFLAGHETTSTTVTFALYELSKRPEVQAALREEIKMTRARVAERGEDEITVADLDSMKYLLAVIKETLRYHPIVPGLPRMAGRDDVIPLMAPLKTKTGEVVTSIPVSKGQDVYISFAAYNRLTSVWGEDADQWRPERFLEGIELKQKFSLGVFANLASFSSGLRGCIGWRFSVLEMQAILIELLESIKLSPPPGNIEIIRGAVGLMTPMVKGSKSGRTELPITLTVI